MTWLFMAAATAGLVAACWFGLEDWILDTFDVPVRPARAAGHNDGRVG